MRLFLSLITLPRSEILVLESISILSSPPLLLALEPTVKSGHPISGVEPRRPSCVYIGVSRDGFGDLRYSTISRVRFLSSSFVIVFAFISQLFAFHVEVTLPSHEMTETSPSVTDPSPLQTFIGFAMTIQFHPWINGESAGGGIFPTILG